MQNVIGTAIHDPWMFFLSLAFVEEFSIGVIRCLHASCNLLGRNQWRFGFCNWKHRSDDRSRVLGLDFQRPSKLKNSFTHASKTNPDQPRTENTGFFSGALRALVARSVRKALGLLGW
jgi:hypothetical protein